MHLDRSCSVTPSLIIVGIVPTTVTSSFIPEDKLSRRAFTLAVMADVVPGRRTMRYDVEVSWALPL